LCVSVHICRECFKIQANWLNRGRFLSLSISVQRLFISTGILIAILPVRALAQQGAPALPINSPAQRSTGEIRTSFYNGREVTYHVVNGRAIYQGDIILGTAGELEKAHAPTLIGLRTSGGNNDQVTGPRPRGATMAHASGLWPSQGGVAQVPYTVSDQTQTAPTAVANLTNAIAAFNSSLSGVIQFVPRNAEPDYVTFDLNPADHSGTCETFVGMIGGQQFATGSIDCTPAVLQHEMGHAIGSWHEQSRMDRNSFVNILTANIDKPFLSNFDQALTNEVDLGLYDYASIMHYVPAAFSKFGIPPTIESVPVAGIPLSNTTGFTTGNVDAFSRLYGHAPTSVTIDSNPSGAQVIIDGTILTTPQVFNWALDSTHTLDIPAGAQTVAGKTCMFGRWNDSSGITAQHTIAITAGDGSVFTPAASPGVTVYTANFVLLHPFGTSVFPANSGTVTPNPVPAISFNGTNYFYDRQPVTITAAPSSGFNFHTWFNTPLFNLSANPYSIFVYDDVSNVTAGFTQNPVTSIVSGTTNSYLPVGGQGPSISLLVDGISTPTPTNSFTDARFPNTNATWTAGSTHIVDGTPQNPSPGTTNISYAFANWSDGGAQSHSITAPAAGNQTTVTANYTPSYRAIVIPSPSCGGTVTPNQDSMVQDGTVMSYAPNPSQGFVFAGWGGDLSGVDNPNSQAIHDQLLATAFFNVTGATDPIAVSSFAPPSATAGNDAVDLVVNGTGFIPGTTNTFWNLNFRSSDVTSPTQITMHLQAGDLGTPGYNRVSVQNVANNCPAFVEATYNVQAR
jgi:hypothetical protein